MDNPTYKDFLETLVQAIEAEIPEQAEDVPPEHSEEHYMRGYALGQVMGRMIVTLTKEQRADFMDGLNEGSYITVNEGELQ